MQLNKLIIIFSVACLAIAQFTPIGIAQTNGCASVSGAPSGLSQLCTSCNAGFYLSGQQSTCVNNQACSSGCTVCQNTSYCYPGACSSGFVYNPQSGYCVDCQGLTFQPSTSGTTVGCSTCVLASNASRFANAVQCTACSTGYVFSSGMCLSCSSTNSNGVNGVANCATCSSTLITTTNVGTNTVAGAGSVVGSWLTCTSCASGYVLIPTYVAAGAAQSYQSVPNCLLIYSSSASASPDPLSSTDGNYWAAALIASANGIQNCTQATFVWSAGTGTLTCTQPQAGFYCLSTNVGATATCVSTAPTGTPSNCASAMFTGATWGAAASPACWSCAANYTLIGTPGTTTASCVQNLGGCATTTVVNGTTVCSAAAPGYNLAYVGAAVVNCVVGGSCSGGCVKPTVLASNGTCVTQTAIPSCTYQNSSSFCVQCNGYSTPWTSCNACAVGCVTCTSNTVCTTCAPGMSMLANTTCVSSQNTTAKSASFLYTGLTFMISLFYFIL